MRKDYDYVDQFLNKLLAVDDSRAVILNGSHAPNHEQTLAEPVKRDLKEFVAYKIQALDKIVDL